MDFDVEAGTGLFIAVDGFGGAIGAIALELELDIPAPEVTLLALDSTAAETPGDPAEFQVRLSAVQAEPVHIEMILSGSATHGLDYSLDVPVVQNLVSFTITPPDVSGNISIAANPDDDPTEFEESVVITLQGSSAYTLGEPNSATAVIADNSPYEIAWAARFPDFSGEDALSDRDPDFDGRPNLLEFAFDSDPTTRDLEHEPRMRIGSFADPNDGNQIKSYLTITFTRRTDTQRISYFAEAASDPVTAGWIPDPVLISIAPGSSPGTERVTYRSATPLDTAAALSNLLLRVRVAEE